MAKARYGPHMKEEKKMISAHKLGYLNRAPRRGVVPPFCSWPQVGRLMGPKPVVGEDQTGFSPDDRNLRTELNYIATYTYTHY